MADAMARGAGRVPAQTRGPEELSGKRRRGEAVRASQVANCELGVDGSASCSSNSLCNGSF
jgi:hypothetical protein